jgi:hypothetical protein
MMSRYKNVHVFIGCDQERIATMPEPKENILPIYCATKLEKKVGMMYGGLMI